MIEFFIRGKKLNLPLAFITKSYFAVQKILDYILNSILLGKIQTSKSFNKSHLIIHEVLNLKTFWIFKKKKKNVKPYSFLVNDSTLASDNHLHFRQNISERIWKLIMTIDDKIRDEKIQYDINTQNIKISTLQSKNIFEYEYLTGKEILPPDQSRVIEQAKFTFSPLRKALEKQTKKTEDAIKR